MRQKILVVGAGAAGLMAARDLAAGGHEVVVIEARNRVGGRVHTITDQFSMHIEAGAEFIHGKQPLTFSLLKECRRDARLLSGNRYQIFDGEIQKGDLFNDDWKHLMNALRELKGDIDMASFLDTRFPETRWAGLRQRVRSFVEGYDAADMSRVSARALREEWEESDDEHQCHIDGGYHQLMGYLTNSIAEKHGRVLCDSPVTEITWASGKVGLRTEDGRAFYGDKAIVTLPLGVLQKGRVKFSPPLPDHAAAFGQMGFGGVIKTFYEFDKAFWEQQRSRPFKDLAFIFSDAGIPTWWTQLPEKTPLLTGWLGGPSTFEIADSAEVLYEKGLRSLEYVFDCPAREIQGAITKYAYANWVTDPFSFGAYAYPTTKTTFAREFISRPLKDTLFFAGEALYTGTAVGTVEAALASGKQVAQSITDKRRNQEVRLNGALPKNSE